jgi:beta-mannosidase
MTSHCLKSSLVHAGWTLFGKSWPAAPERLGFSLLEPLPAEVPGHVHLDLLRAGVIADPFAAAHELGCQWVDEEDWSYRTRFEFSPDPARPRRLLRFEGLDTVCSVWLNREQIAEHDNMFVPLELDVSERLVAGSNELRVDFLSAARVARERRRAYLERESLPETTLHFHERSFVRKAQYMFGWDWGPRLVSAGIWKPLRLLEYRSRLLDVRVRERYLEGGDVELTFESSVDGPGEVLHFVEGNGPVRDGEPLRLSKPELWWPAGFGPQRLHRATSLLVEAGAGGQRAALEAGALDRCERRLGFRRLRLLEERDSFGRSFEFEVNGKKLWAVGANWIPDDSFPARVSDAQTRRALERARDLGMNMLRVWGGGLYESDTFYDAADELGLLVWQDFAYACSYYPDDEASQVIARGEALAALTRLRHHPSLALWCGNNENLTMYFDKWGGAEGHPARYYGETIYERVLPELIAELDSGRPYIPSSPYGGEAPNGGGTGDQHYWDVWHGRGDYPFYADSSARFSSEFGFASAPGRQALGRMLHGIETPLEQSIRHPLARWHDKTAKGYDTFVGYVELHYPRSENLEEWSYYSQLNQRDALRFGIEHYRRSEFCKGALIWQLNDCWPVQSWAVIDSEGDYKAAAFDLRRLYAPLLLSIEKRGDLARLWVVLDNALEPCSGKVVLEARSLTNGDVFRHWTAKVKLLVGERRVALEAELGGLPAHDTLLVASFGDVQASALLVEPKELSLSPACLRASADSISLTIESDGPLVDLLIWDEEDALVLYDNFVTLPEAGRFSLRARGVPSRLAARSLAGRHEIVTPPSAPARR